MTRLLAAIPFAIAVILGGFFLWGLNPERDPNEIPSVLISQPVPAFDLPPIPGLETPGLSRDNLAGAPALVVVNVFASWCLPCRAEHGVLTSMRRGEDIVLFGINYKDKPEDATRWLAGLGNPYDRIGSDLNGRAGIEWGISGVPETFIVSPRGIVLHRTVGPIVGDDAVAKFRAALAAARAAMEGNS